MAQKLSMTVAEMRARMDQSEFIYWTRYYALKAQREELERLRAGV